MAWERSNFFLTKKKDYRDSTAKSIVPTHIGFATGKTAFTAAYSGNDKSSRSEVFCKKGALKNSQENTCERDSFLTKLQASGLTSQSCFIGETHRNWW